MRITASMSAVFLLIFVSGCDRSSSSATSAPKGGTHSALPVDQQRLQTADLDSANWMSTGRTYSEQRFSPLKAISSSTVSKLHLAWHYDLEAMPVSQQSTPLVIDGVMYVSTAWSKVVALDAVTGALRWQYDPKVPRQWGINACCDPANDCDCCDPTSGRNCF